MPKTATVLILFLREKHKSVTSFCRDALKLILNDSQLILVALRQLLNKCRIMKQVIKQSFIHIKLDVISVKI